ncbi:MAG: AAA family ATPase [Candidatus Omnitrophota bacterium]
MLIEFKVGNFRSFKDVVTLSMVASSDPEHLKTHTVEINDRLRLLRSAAIYGANAGGKSNLFKAMNFMRDFVLNSSKESQFTEPINVESFRLSTETENKPSVFEILFLVDDIRYRYGFEADNECVHHEWLYVVPKTREVTLFTREKNKIKLGSTFKEGKGLESRTRENALFLSVVAQFNGSTARKILEWFYNLRIVSDMDANEYRSFTLSKLNDSEYKKFTEKFLKSAGLGIKEIRIKHRREIEIHTVHQKYDANNQPASDEMFNLADNESGGTLMLFGLSALLYDTVKNGKILVIDELTSRLHPLITEAIIGAFHDYRIASRSQLLFISHDITIFTNRLFRRDQLWFTQKDKYGATDLYSLEEYALHEGASFNKDYVMGKYGGIPRIENIESLFF